MASNAIKYTDYNLDAKQFMHYVFNTVYTKLTFCHIGKTKPGNEQESVDRTKRNGSILIIKSGLYYSFVFRLY